MGVQAPEANLPVVESYSFSDKLMLLGWFHNSSVSQFFFSSICEDRRTKAYTL